MFCRLSLMLGFRVRRGWGWGARGWEGSKPRRYPLKPLLTFSCEPKAQDVVPDTVTCGRRARWPRRNPQSYWAKSVGRAAQRRAVSCHLAITAQGTIRGSRGRGLERSDKPAPQRELAAAPRPAGRGADSNAAALLGRECSVSRKIPEAGCKEQLDFPVAPCSWEVQ